MLLSFRVNAFAAIEAGMFVLIVAIIISSVNWEISNDYSSDTPAYTRVIGISKIFFNYHPRTAKNLQQLNLNK
tara:strand:+ start:2333 stop:2551 length:219 start_codon:yes stop_codon:yes gene_type:complete